MRAWSSWAAYTTKQNRIYQFFRKRFNRRRLQFLFAYSFSNWLAVLCFPFEKLLLNVRYDVISTYTLQCWVKFSNVFVYWSIRMFHAKNYETRLCLNLSKLCLEILWLLFFRTRCIVIGICTGKLTYRRTVTTVLCSNESLIYWNLQIHSPQFVHKA